MKTDETEEATAIYKNRITRLLLIIITISKRASGDRFYRTWN